MVLFSFVVFWVLDYTSSDKTKEWTDENGAIQAEMRDVNKATSLSIGTASGSSGTISYIPFCYVSRF